MHAVAQLTRRAGSCLARALARVSGWLWPPAAGAEPAPNSQAISLLVLVIVAGFSSAVAFHYVMGYYLDRPWPASTFLYVPSDRFFDFDLVVKQSAGLDPFGVDIGGFAGSPLAQLVGYLFSLVRPSWLRLPLFFMCFFVVFVPMVKYYLCGPRSRLAWHHLPAIFVLAFLTYPVLFALDRANFDLLVCACLLLFAFLYQQQKYTASTVFMAMAIALKPYAIVLALVYVLHRRYRDFALVLAGTVFLSALSLAVFKDGLFAEAQKYLHALSNMANNPSFGSDFVYTSDIFGGLTMLIKSVSQLFNHPLNLPDHPTVKMVYLVLAGAAGLYLTIQTWRNPKPLWKRMAILTILIILLPLNTHDYRLLYLFPPMLMFMAANETSRHDLVLVLLWALLLVPKAYWPLGSTQTIGMVINPLLLIGLLVCLLPEAFSRSGIASLFRPARNRVATGSRRELENACSS